MCVRDSDSPVCFTPSSPPETSPGSLVFYDVVDCDVVSRCSVLSCIAEAGGEARLPEAVTVSDFRTWLTAVPPGAQNRDLTNLDLSTMCTAAKVSDALDDPQVGRWVELIADYLSHRLGHKLRPLMEMDAGPDRDAIILEALSCFLELPDHIQSRVYMAAAREVPSAQPKGGPELHNLLALVPKSLHPKVVAAVINPDTALQATLSKKSIPFLDALASIPASPPQLLSLEVSWEARVGSVSDKSARRLAQDLATALRHQSGLTSLSLGALCNRTATLQLLAPALSTLALLQSLKLGAKDESDRSTEEPLPGEQLPFYAEIRMSMLELHDYPAMISSTKRQCYVPAQLQHCLASTLSAASALTSLHIYDVSLTSQQEVIRVYSALTLPQLVNLRIEVHRCQQATTLLSHLDAPLTTLTLAEATYSCMPEEDTSDIVALIHQVSRFKQLRRLHVPNAFARTWPGWALAVMLHSSSPELAALQQLHTLEFWPDARVLKLAAQRFSSAAPSVRRMSLHAFDTFRTEKEEWPDIIRGLSQLPLQELALSLDSVGPRLADLLPLTCLTGMQLDLYRLDPEDDFHCTAVKDIAALGQMTQLRLLHLCRRCCMAYESDAALMRHLAALPHLTSLIIEETPVTNALLESISAAASPWPALQRLAVSVSSRGGSDTEALIRAVGSLPSFKKLSLIFSVSFGCSFNSQGLEGGADDDPESRLRAIAGQMGIAISVSHESSYRTFPPFVEL